jgi:hypothetical protein
LESDDAAFLSALLSLPLLLLLESLLLLLLLLLELKRKKTMIEFSPQSPMMLKI